MLPERLTSIDATNREHHVFLEPGDQCFFFGEYCARKGYQGGATNRLILNFKCKPSAAAASRARRAYKEHAMSSVAAGLRRAISRHDAERITWVPVPSSKTASHADHDDRLVRTLHRAFCGYAADVRPLLRQSASTESDHTAGGRLTPEALEALIELDHAALNALPLRQTVVLFDDVLTTGKHFKCCERRLRACLPGSPTIIGMFIARRILREPSEVFGEVSSRISTDIHEQQSFCRPAPGLEGDFPGRRESILGGCGKNIHVFHARENPLPDPAPH